MSRLVIALTIGLCLLVSVAGAEDWPTFHRDPQRTGVSGEPWTPHDLSVAWSTPVDAESVDASPAVVAGRVYVGTATGKLVCLGAQGEKVWEYATGGAVLSAPTVTDGLVIAGSADRCLYALEATTGKLVWRVKTRRPVVAPPLCAEGRVYVGGVDGVFRCVETRSGKLLWEAREAGEISGGAALGEKLVYYGDERGNVSCRATADGTLQWTVKLAGGIVASPLLAAGKLIVPVMSDTALSPPPTPCVTVLDPTNGQQLWALTRGSSVLHTPVTDGTNVYFATVSGYLSDTELLACRLEDGTEVWKRRLGGVLDSSPLLAGGVLIFGNHDRNLYCVETTSGTVQQALGLDAKLFASPALSGGALYIGAQDGKVYCLR